MLKNTRGAEDENALPPNNPPLTRQANRMATADSRAASMSNIYFSARAQLQNMNTVAALPRNVVSPYISQQHSNRNVNEATRSADIQISSTNVSNNQENEEQETMNSGNIGVWPQIRRL